MPILSAYPFRRRKGKYAARASSLVSEWRRSYSVLLGFLSYPLIDGRSSKSKTIGTLVRILAEPRAYALARRNLNFASFWKRKIQHEKCNPSHPIHRDRVRRFCANCDIGGRQPRLATANVLAVHAGRAGRLCTDSPE
jgi:hypothetical protein